MTGISGSLLAACFPFSKKKIRLTFKDNFASRGHETWKKQVVYPASEPTEKTVVIVGAGISGLSAAYHLQKYGIKNILLLELADAAGGNSQSGKNAGSEYPYGAHYLTLPNPENAALIRFLKDKNIITGFDAQNRPIYNETDLCFDPEERLLLKGTFQDGLVPNYVLTADEKKEISRFFKLMEEYRLMKGSDHKFFFNIPCSLASSDPELNHLDGIYFKDFLEQHNFKSEYLKWYLNYCCRDDFGGDTTKVSAWAGINYFAAHRAEAVNTDGGRVLTWSEGNGHLVKFLMQENKEVVRTGCLVNTIRLANGKVILTGLDFTAKTRFEIHSDSCIVAIPPFVAGRILDKSLPYPFEKTKALKHTPWLTAAVTLAHIPEAHGVGLCWDNVAYGSRSLGYINNRHQELKHPVGKAVISLYLPLDDTDDRTSRKILENRREEEWQALVLKELEIMHPGITELVEEMELCLWGHGMILPSKDLTKSGILTELARPIDNKIFFAHTDLSAYSIFEEAFDWGHRAATNVKNKPA